MRKSESSNRLARPSILKPGTRLKLGRYVWRSEGRGPNGRISFIREGAQTRRYHSRQQIDDLVSSGRAEILPPSLSDQLDAHQTARVLTDLSTVRKEEQAKVIRRAAYVKAVLKQALKGMSKVSLTPIIEGTAKLLEDPCPPHWRTVIDWIALYRRTDNIIGLVDQRVGNSIPRFIRALRDVIEATVTTVYLTPARHSMRETHRKLRLAIADANQYLSPSNAMRTPSYKALRHYISSLDGFDVLAQRFGYRFAKRHYRAYKLGPQPDRALEMVEIDSTVLDCRCLYKGCLDLGRPTLTIAICRRTRCVLYAGLSFEPAGYQTVMDCMVGIILGRDNLLAELGLPPGSWPMRGLPELIRVDNGKEYRSAHLENAIAHLEKDIEFCPPRQPWFKGVVERQIGTITACIVQSLPGHTFPLKARDGDHKDDAYALLDLNDVQKIIIQWVTTIYHETPHPVLTVPPRVAWEECTAIDPPECRFTDDEVRVYCGRVMRRAVSSKGVEIDGLLYNSDELGALRHHIDHLKDHPDRDDLDPEQCGDGKILIKQPGGMDYIYALDPLGRRYIRVPAIAQKYTQNLSRRRHKLNQKLAKWNADEYVAEVDLLHAHREIDRLIKSASLHAAEILGLSFARATTEDTRNSAIQYDDGSPSTQSPSAGYPADPVTPPLPARPLEPPRSISPEDLLAELAARTQSY